MRSIADKPSAAALTEPDAVEAILTEVSGLVGDLKCASMGKLVQSNVSMTQMHVLWLLQHHGAVSMSKLAELLDVSMSNATGLMDRMEEHGLIERVRVPDDRRLVLIRPAAGGLEALSATETERRARLRAVVSRLAPADRPIVFASLRSLRRALSAEVESDQIHHHHFAEMAN